MKSYIIVFLTCVMLVACQSQELAFNLEKDGELYNYNEIISFYYPRTWNINKDDLKLSLDIVNEAEEEALYFDTFELEESNAYNELLALYVSKLTSVGVEITHQQEDVLDYGQNCFYLEGVMSKNQLSFCEVVVFVGQKQYVYSYIAKDELYEANKEEMMHYLKSMVVNEAMKMAL